MAQICGHSYYDYDMVDRTVDGWLCKDKYINIHITYIGLSSGWAYHDCLDALPHSRKYFRVLQAVLQWDGAPRSQEGSVLNVPYIL